MRFIPYMTGTRFWKYPSRSDFSEYIIAFLVMGITAAVCFPLTALIGTVSIGLILLMVVALLALFLGRWPLMFAAILNVALWDYFFQEPLFTFGIHDLEDLFANIADLLVAVVYVILITRIRKSETTLQNSQEKLSILYDFLESMNDATSIPSVVGITGEVLKKHVGGEPVIYLRERHGRSLEATPFGNADIHSAQGFSLAAKLFLDANLGRDSDSQTSPEGITYLVLREPRETIGIIGIRLPADVQSDEDKMILFKSFLTILASTLGREISMESAMEKGFLAHSEKLFQAVLNSVSHELRTPISIISAAVDNLNDPRTASEPEKRRQVCIELESASTRLNNLVENILDMSRIESGMLRLNMQYCDLADLTGLVVKDMKSELSGSRLIITMPENLPMIKADISLLRQVLVNILRNAIMYTPAGTAIGISGLNEPSNRVSLTIHDNGPGVSEENLSHLFEKFYRVPGSKSGGTGLGLAIAKAFVEAHGGFIKAANEPGGGLSITMIFKAEE